MSEANKAAVRGYIEEVMIKGQGDVSKFEKYVQPDAILHNAYPATGSDINAWKDRVRMFAAAFTEIHVTIHDQIAEGDKVVTRTVFSGGPTVGHSGASRPPADVSMPTRFRSLGCETARSPSAGAFWMCQAS
jgi:predicted ester cyclase